MPISLHSSNGEFKSRMYEEIIQHGIQAEIQEERRKEDEVTLNEDVNDFNFGIYDDGKYIALILETKTKQHFVVGEMQEKAIWKKPQKENCPMRSTSRWTQSRVFSGGLLQIDSFDDCSISIYEIARKYCMVVGFENIVSCNVTEAMRAQDKIRQNFKVPEHLENIIAFVATSDTYIRILNATVEVIRNLSVIKDTAYQQDAVYLSCALIKILEDAFYQSECVTQPLKKTDSSHKIEWFTGKDEVTLAIQICDEVKALQMMSINSIKKDEASSLHAICLHWAARRFHSDSDLVPTEKPSFFAELHRIGKRFLETGNIEEVFLDKDLSMIDIPYSIEVHNNYDKSSSKLFHKMMESISREELFVLLEVLLMDISLDFHTSRSLSALIFLHEIKGLPFSALRGLNYSHFLTRTMSSTLRNANPGGFLPGDNLSAPGCKEPTKSWLEKTWPDTAPSLDPQEAQSVVTAVTLCPELAKLRLTGHYNQARENFRKDHGKELALSDASFITENILSKSLTELRTYSDACRKETRGSLIAAYAYEAVGGPFTAIKDCYVSSMRNSGAVDNLLENGLPFPPHDLSAMIDDYNHAVNREWESADNFKPFIQEKNWTYAAAASLLMKEIFFVYRGIGSFPRNDEGKQQQKCMFDWLHEKRPMVPPENGFNIQLLSKNTPYLEGRTMDYHLYRHNPVPVDNAFPTRSFPPVKSLDEIRKTLFASLSPYY